MGRERKRSMEVIGAVGVLVLLCVVGVSAAGASPGALDQGFGTGGVVQTDLSGLDAGFDVMLQPDGKAVIIGVADGNGVVLRHRTNGTLDPAFGTGGVVRSSEPAFLHAGALQADGKIVAVGSNATLDDVVVFRYLPSGAPDSGFGTAGVVRTDFGTVDQGSAVVLQPDGRIVVAGRSGDALALARYLPNGMPDPTFGTGGRTTTTFGSGTSAEAGAVGILSTGGIVVGGLTGPSDSGDLSMLLARYTPGGVLDGAYGQGGRVAPADGRLMLISSLVVQSGDRVVVAGWTARGEGQAQALARYLPDGSLDPAFGTGGSIRTTLGVSNSVEDLAVDAAGRLVAAGAVSYFEQGFESGGFSFVSVSRFSPDGAVDAGFGCAGSTQVELVAPGGGRGTAIAVAPDGRIVVGGIAFTDPTTDLGRPDLLLIRLLGDGSADAGYRVTRADGGTSPFGAAPGCGSLRGLPLNQPVVGHAARPSGDGYWFVASDGGVFTQGDAPFLGSTGGVPLNRPVVGMARTPSGNGYWLVAGDGGIFAFGDARFFGSTGGVRLNRPVVGMASTPSGNGYWLVAGDGGIFAYGDATFLGSTGSLALNRPIVGMTRTASGGGYWLAAADGGIFAHGDAPFLGSTGGQPYPAPAVAIT